jgi:hypothetical protein
MLWPIGICVGFLSPWVAFVVGWRRSVRRLGLRGRDPDGMDRAERVARRSLRAVLAFDFLVVWPVALPLVPLLIWSFTTDPCTSVTELVSGCAWGLLALAMFTAAPFLLASRVKALERCRLSGGAEPVPRNWFLDRVLLRGSPHDAASRSSR